MIGRLREAETSPERTGANRSARARVPHVGRFGWIWLSLAGVFVLSAMIAPGTLTVSNLTAMLPFAGVLVIAAAGQTLVIQQRGLDLSLPGTISLCALAMAKTEAAHGPWAAAFVSLVLAIAIGTLNGLLVVRLAITPLVATLAVNSLVLGGVFSYSHGLPVSTSAGLTDFTRAKPLGVPNLAIIAVVLVVVLELLSRRSTTGRRFTAVGATPAAARAAGLTVPAYQLGAYVAAAICAGAAGVLLAGFTGSATSTLGTPYLLTAIAAVVVGGTPLTGGRGSLVATAAAALLLSQLGQLTLALGAPTSIQLFVQAVVLVLATGLHHVRRTSGDGGATEGRRRVTKGGGE